MCVESKVAEFLDKYNLFDKTLLVGFSGGYDSSCLLKVLCDITEKSEQKPHIIAIHFNHNWRGEKAKQEQEKCSEFCKNNNIEFYAETAPNDVKKNETVARELRYAFFEKCSEIYKSKYNKEVAVLTAHNWDDNAETILYRIAKGTGIVGLKGILPQRGQYFRPLLEVRRVDIEQYCALYGLEPNHDESNDDIVHKRNLIRHDILPLLEKINPDIKNALNNLSRVAISECALADEYISKLSKKVLKDDVIDTKLFMGLSDEVKQKIIYNLIYNSKFDYTYDTIINICRFIEKTVAENKPSKFSLDRDNWIYVDKNIIDIISKPPKDDSVIEITKNGEYNLSDKIFKIEEAAEYHKTGTENIVYVDLSGFDKLYLRTRRDGDVINPLGSNGRMKLKKYLMSKNIPQYKRDSLVLLTDGEEILWVAGVGMSDKIKVKTVPTHILSIQ